MPTLFQHSIYLTGESYAGQWLPLLGNAIQTKTNWRLAGVAIGNGFVDPPSQRPNTIEKIQNTGVVLKGSIQVNV
jgi:carboxypeptidase C (cathepsin A)